MGYPDGGPKDETAPRVISSLPQANQLNFKKKKIVIEFDEIVKLENYLANFIISPPMTALPIVKAFGRRVEVEITEDFQENATYTLDFGNSIVDNNEKNPLKNYSLSFATGNIIDSLQMRGKLLNAFNLEPEKGFIIGIYSNTEDSAFRTLVPLRIAKTSTDGSFSIKNISPGSYRIVALKEGSQNLKYDNNGEKIAFWSEQFSPYIDSCTFSDTLWVDSVTVDSVHVWKEPCYKPDNLLLFAFEESFYNQYFIKAERKERRRIDLYFAENTPSNPVLEPMNFESDAWSLLDNSVGRDTFSYWITDSTIYNNDTLQFLMHFDKTDSLGVLVPAIDTLKLIYREKKVAPIKRKKKGEEIKKALPVLAFSHNAKGALDVYKQLVFNFTQPIDQIVLESIELSEKVDSTLISKTFSLTRDSILHGRIYIEHKWNPGSDYVLALDSAAFIDIYGLASDDKEYKFKVQALDQYANLKVNLLGEKSNGVIQLLNKNEKVIRQVTFSALEKTIMFKYLKPSKYYLKLFFDPNNNGLWDPGNYDKQEQSEMVIYYPKPILLEMANWDLEEDWDIWSTPVIEQKLVELKPPKVK